MTLSDIKQNAVTKCPEYYPWASMVQRCTNPNYSNYQRYGGAGICVDKSWISGRNGFLAFRRHIGPRPSANHQIDRIKSDGHYEPGNVRWATTAEQARNRSSNKIITFAGQTMCTADWARQLGLSHQSLCTRLKLWPLERALTEPPRITAVYRQRTKTMITEAQKRVLIDLASPNVIDMTQYALGARLTTLRSLKSRGLIRGANYRPFPSITRYAITDSGRIALGKPNHEEGK